MKPIVGDRSLTSQVEESLRRAIFGGELAPGSMHSVRKLADQLAVSRTPVREALARLETQGMVRFERNRGVRILQTTLHDLREIFELRLLLEVPETYRAAAQLTPSSLTELEHAFAAMERAADADDEQRLMERDRRFHRVIMEAGGNRRLAGYVDVLRDMVLVRGASTAGHSRTLHDIVDEHRGILERVRSGDAAGAAEAMRAHVRHTAELLIAQEAGTTSATALLDFDWMPSPVSH